MRDFGSSSARSLVGPISALSPVLPFSGTAVPAMRKLPTVARYVRSGYCAGDGPRAGYNDSDSSARSRIDTSRGRTETTGKIETFHKKAGTRTHAEVRPVEVAGNEPQAQPEAAGAAPVLELRHAAKSFGAVRALIDGSVDLRAGEVHALLGENGAGKSTLVKILAGVYQPDSGTLKVNGQEVALPGPAAAKAAGIAVIYQEPTLFPDLTVAENMFVGRQPHRSASWIKGGRRIDRRAMLQETAAVFKRLGVPLDPARIARGLSIADQQVVEIGKALSLDARVIVMDEPTAALSATEVTRLFEVVRTLCGSGAAVLFITHRLEEVFEICQRATVMRDGAHVLTTAVADVTTDDLVRAMVGRDMPVRTQAEHGTVSGETVLQVRRLTREGVFVDISFEVKAGEIVALAGLVGSGRSEVARAIFGIDPYDAGSVRVSGQPLRRRSPTAAMSAGIGFVPEDRRQHGLVMDLSTEEN